MCISPCLQGRSGCGEGLRLSLWGPHRGREECCPFFHTPIPGSSPAGMQLSPAFVRDNHLFMPTLFFFFFFNLFRKVSCIHSIWFKIRASVFGPLQEWGNMVPRGSQRGLGFLCHPNTAEMLGGDLANPHIPASRIPLNPLAAKQHIRWISYHSHTWEPSRKSLFLCRGILFLILNEDVQSWNAQAKDRVSPHSSTPRTLVLV